jgi:very-short-patch-repair endonuclease
MGRCDSELERDFLRYLREHGHRLPDSAQDLIADHGTRPDFMYTGHGKAAIYIDGPYHDYPERQARDEAITWQLEDDGYVVIRFGHNDDWAATIARRLDLFGEGR